ncbi:hypothetical protein Tco_0620948 [Tanacetum coccineum]
MPSSPSSPHRHHHLLAYTDTTMPSSPPRTITSTHAKHHRDNFLEGASGGGNSTEGAFVLRVTATKGVRECVWLSGLVVETDSGDGMSVGFCNVKKHAVWVAAANLGGEDAFLVRLLGQSGTARGRDVGFGSQTQGVRWCVGSPPKGAFGLY